MRRRADRRGHRLQAPRPLLQLLHDREQHPRLRGPARRGLATRTRRGGRPSGSHDALHSRSPGSSTRRCSPTPDVGLMAAWVNDVLHRVVPLAILLDWVAVRPLADAARSTRSAGSPARSRTCLLTHPRADRPLVPVSVPRPRRKGGYVHVALTCVILAIRMALLSLLISWIGDRRSATWGPR